VRGTPSFFINGNIFVGAQPFSAFEAAIQQAESGEIIAAAPPETAPSQPQVPTPVAIEPRTQTAIGDPNAPVTIIEYSDYQCPFCRRHVQETMPQLKENFIDTGRVYYVFKDFPIESLHPLAYRLHEAALCAADSGELDEYWQAHDVFFDQAESFQVESESNMDEAILNVFAASGLPDISQCLAEDKFANEVKANVAEGVSFGVDGTPAFFINGYPISGAQPYELFEYAIGLAEENRLAEAYQPQEQAPPTEPPQQIDMVLGDAPRKGSPDAPITIVEYSDYQCPFCLRYFNETMPQLQPLIEDGTIQYVFKDFPLLNIHPQSQKAHEAAHCARELGGENAYWVMHDLLFANQEAWASVSMADHVEVIKELAAEANLPQSEFDTCLDNGRYAETVSNYVAEGIQLGITGTPTFFINGNRLVGAQPISVFQQVIEQLKD
jgi:protein-disulfide isomerase